MVDSKQIFSINFADDWVQTADIWCWNQLLCQLSHKHSPIFWTIIIYDFRVVMTIENCRQCDSRVIIYVSLAKIGQWNKQKPNSL